MKTCDVAMQRTNSNLMAEVIENIGPKIRFQTWFSIHLVLHRLCSRFISYQIYDCVTIESNVLHQFESYLQRLFCINILWSLRKRGRLKIDIEFGISIPCFWQCPQQVSLSPLHCDVECFSCDRWKSQRMYISNLASYM